MPSNTSQGTRSASPPSSRRDQVVTMARRQDKAIEAHAFAGSVAVAGSVTETNAPERKDGADHNSHQGSEYINAPGWLITTQHPSHHFQHHPDSDSPAYLHGELLRRGEPDYRPGPEQHTRMPDDTSPPSYLFHQTLAKKTPSFSHRHHPHQHASEQVSASPYATSSGDRSRSHGSPTSPTGSVDHSRSSRAGSRGLDLATTTAAEHRSEPSGPQTSTEAQSPNRRRTRVLMTRVQSEALNRLWSQTMFPSTSERETLAQQIGLTARQVQVWFQNQRQKRRRERETDDAVQSQHPPDMVPHAMGWPSSTMPSYSPPARMTPMALSYPPPPHSAPFNQRLSQQRMLPTRALTHPPPQRPARRPDDYRRGLSDSHLLPAVRHSNTKVPSAWRQPSPRGDFLFGSGNGRGSGDTTGSDESAGLAIVHESQAGPHRRPRSISTSQPHRWASYPDSSPPPPSRFTLQASSMPAHSSSFAHADGFSAGSRPEDGPYGYNSRSMNQAPPDSRGLQSAPARASQLPPSLSSMVIDSPFGRRAGPEAITLQPLNVCAVQGDEDMAEYSPHSDGSLSPRPRGPRRPSSDYDDGQGPNHISVADLIN